MININLCKTIYKYIVYHSILYYIIVYHMPSLYKKNTTLDERKIKSQKLKELYPNRIPVIVEMSFSSK